MLFYNCGHYKEAAPALQVEMIDHPEDKTLRRALGISMIKNGDADGARPVLAKLLEEAPADFEAVAAMAYLHYEKQEYADAVQQYATAIQIAEPEGKLVFPDLHIGLARCYEAQQRLPDAIEQYQAVLTRCPQDWTVHYFCGLAYEEDAKLREAATDKNDRLAQARAEFTLYYNNTNVLDPYHREVAERLGKPPVPESQ